MPARISERMIRSRAEHNEGMLSTLEEVALHQQNIEKIELLGQLCPRLKIIYLQNNLISKIQNLHKLKVRADLRGPASHSMHALCFAYAYKPPVPHMWPQEHNTMLRCHCRRSWST